MKRTLVMTLVLMLVLALAACSPSSPSAPVDQTAATSAPPAATEKPAEEPADEPEAEGELPYVVLDWYVGMTPMPDNQMVSDAISDYLKEKINAGVQMHYWEGKEWEEKMTVMVAAGQDVGIIGFGSQSKLDYVIQSQRGSFYPLEDLLATYGQGTKALFQDAIWESMTINGHIFGIPSLKDNCYIISMIYNDDMANDLGIDMNQVEYLNWRSIETFLGEVMEKRTEKYGELVEPLCGNAELEMPYNFAVESFLNDSFLAVCNIDGINDVAGYDSQTIFNLYATDEYREFCKGRVRMVDKNIFAYDYEGKTEWNYTGNMFAWPGWGYTYMQEHLYGDNFVTKMVEPQRVWTDTNNYFSAGTAISANCSDPERAMMILNLANTDPGLATMLRFGIEGEHYVRDDAGLMQFAGSKRNGGDRADYGYYYWYMAPVGNLTIVEAPESLIGPDGIMLTKMQQYNNNASIPSHMGFVFNLEPVSNEIAACTNVVMEYRDTLRRGQLGSEAEVDSTIDQFLAKLEANGSQTIIDEVQSQIEAWKASK